MRYHIGDLNPEELLRFYGRMLKPRMIEEKMLILLRQGKVPKWFSGMGQEAISVGVASALKDSEYILPMHRNLGVFTTRNVPLKRLFAQWQGKASGFTKGRDRSFHFGSQEHKIVGMISHLGPQLGVANGIALADLIRKKKRVTAVFTGEGATSEGDFHEALNVASVWNLPILFCIENNGYGLSTPTREQYNCEHLADRAKGYGIEGRIIEGNNILEVYTKVNELCKALRKRPRPVLLEFKTFRMRGHEEASGIKYVPEKTIKEWAKKDPIANFEAFLLKQGILNDKKIEKLKTDYMEEINMSLKMAFDEDPVVFNGKRELDDIYQKTEDKPIEPGVLDTQEIRFVDAVSQGLRQSMEEHNELVLMGQDIAEYGGVFKITEGFVKEFGRNRVRNTPICESVIVSAAMGLSINSMKAVVEMQFADFVSSGFNPIVNYLAKIHYRWGQNADVVIRMPCGGGVGAGPFHSQTNEAWFTKTPGLKVVYPAFPADAKGLLTASINDPNPVLFFEHKGLYRSISGDVPKAYYTLPLGKASLLKEGNDVSIVTFGAGVHWALETLERHSNISADLIDLRTLAPLDTETIYQSVQKTGKLIILQEDTLFGGVASDISAMVTEHCFEYLDGPIKRVASLDTPVPFAKSLEEGFLPKKRFEDDLLELLAY
ncbi:dehydrogenase E1 component subunit alpha/beta [Muricauda sp. SCSIO 64092]|uniref:alpha-ketoacid dehydrogenase subunit alpha/beta n=1 Tax=Allomuricauda sp. SCSIO 64092 TaxID=2908842 RepID=UPI001FF52E99|nr:dehydrogenase E1 component subunit alpha/beta [Muricauda sp. SCSIO 64092]UOY06461.1 dehydrogenase E1 component subunit alpha/beta [Muricauda sp. SCSIO 64092]